MYQKPNNGGDLQPFIPKGNGEHSGEFTYKNITAESYIKSKNGKKLDKSFEIKHISSNKDKLRNVINILKDNNIPNIEVILDELFYINVEARRDYPMLLNEVYSIQDIINHIDGMERIYGVNSKKLSSLLNELQNGKIDLDDYNNYYVSKKIKGNTTIEDDLRKTNPNYGTSIGYTYNCINCVITLLFRRFKKLDVTAKPVIVVNGKISPIKTSLILGLRNPIPFYKIRSKKDVVDNIKNYPNKCFFMLTAEWTDKNFGHAIAIEKDEDNIMFLDAQKGMYLDDSYFDNIKKETIRIYRIDDINYDDYVLNCYKSGE